MGRALTLPMIRRLSQLLDIPADVLIQPYKTIGRLQERDRPTSAGRASDPRRQG